MTQRLLGICYIASCTDSYISGAGGVGSCISVSVSAQLGVHVYTETHVSVHFLLPGLFSVLEFVQ